MTPGLFSTPFYRGAAWSFAFNFFDTAGDPLDLTGLGPFTMSIQAPNFKLDVEGTGDYDADGIVTFSLTKAQADTLPIGSVMVGVRDADDMPYMAGVVQVHPFAS